jgi:hypothetical protein
MASLRQLLLVLEAILARPWFWLALVGFGLSPAFQGLSYLTTPSATLTDVAIVPGPAVPPNGGADIREDQLATITDWYALHNYKTVANPGGGVRLVESDRDRSERNGDWDILDRLSALERLWMTPPAVLSKEGWRRIGDHAGLQLLSLRGVGRSYAVGGDSFATDGRGALARLPRLRQLSLRVTDAVLLPPLPALEACCIGWSHLEENLDTLADGSPRLQVLALETYPASEFTPGMLAAIQQMPSLRTVYLAAATSPDDEPAMTRQVAELQRAVPDVRIRPGSYSTKRVAVVGWATAALAAISFVFWFQAATLLATPLAWMLPRRFPPHAVWPIAVAGAGGAAVIILCRSFGVAWLPTLALTLFASGIGIYGPVWGDMAGWPTRLTRLAIGADYACGLLFIGSFMGAAATADRWLTGYEPAAAVALVIVAAAGLGWKIARVARLPRIVAEGGQEAFVASTMSGGQAGAWRAGSARANRADGRWWRPDVAIDKQLARPLPQAATAACGFADMLRWPQLRLQILLIVGFMLAAGVVISALPGILRGSDTASWPPTKGWAAMVAANFTWQAAAISLLSTAGLWWQRRSSLVLDFLRPVSRRDYWLGLRQAIARDLTVPLAVVALGLAASASWWGHGHMLPWFVSAAAFGGLVAAAHTAFLLIATGCRPLIAATSAVVVLFVAAVGLVGAVRESLLYAVDRDATHRWVAIAIAMVVLGVGLAIRAAVLWKLEDREIA